MNNRKSKIAEEVDEDPLQHEIVFTNEDYAKAWLAYVNSLPKLSTKRRRGDGDKTFFPDSVNLKSARIEKGDGRTKQRKIIIPTDEMISYEDGNAFMLSFTGSLRFGDIPYYAIMMEDGRTKPGQRELSLKQKARMKALPDIMS